MPWKPDKCSCFAIKNTSKLTDGTKSLLQAFSSKLTRRSLDGTSSVLRVCQFCRFAALTVGVVLDRAKRGEHNCATYMLQRKHWSHKHSLKVL